MATDDLTAKQHKAIAALLSEPTIKAAAAALGVGERTVHNWLADPAFEAEYRKARRHAVRQAIARLQQSSATAADALRDVAEDANAKGSERVAAARAILELAIRGVELEDLEERIAALEARHASNA